MGAFIISDISFKTLRDRKKFETKYNLQKKDILVDENTHNFGFGAYLIFRNPTIDVIYNLGFMGYYDPITMLRECLKEKIKIAFWAWLPINDRNTKWEKIRGRW